MEELHETLPCFFLTGQEKQGQGRGREQAQGGDTGIQVSINDTPKKHYNNASKQSKFDTEQKCTFLTATYIECNGINQDNGVLTKVIPLMFILQK